MELGGETSNAQTINFLCLQDKFQGDCFIRLKQCSKELVKYTIYSEEVIYK